MDRKIPYKQSNKEVVDELTKNVEEACAIGDDEKLTSWENKEENDLDEDDNGKQADEESQAKKNLDEDSVIEINLKDRDLNLTEEEKEQLKVTAETLKNEGNEHFRSLEYDKALDSYSQAIKECPLQYSKERSILFANRAAAKSKLQHLKPSAVNDCSKAIELDPNYLKAYLRRAHLHEELTKLDEAFEDFKKVVELDPSHSEANVALRRLPPLIQERNEKMKTEMLGKLKDLGNLFLKPFGLSTNNFELQKDDNSGGYSVKFNQGAT